MEDVDEQRDDEGSGPGLVQRTGTAWSTSSGSRGGTIGMHSRPSLGRMFSVRGAELAAPIPPAERETIEDNEGEGERIHKHEPQPPRMSLMALLEQTDDGGGVGSGGLGDYSSAAVADDEEDEEGGGRGERMHVCCVCMVRGKGAAFIPCGHTFCRLCSRELWIGRGNCPLCNGFILEILDIF